MAGGGRSPGLPGGCFPSSLTVHRSVCRCKGRAFWTEEQKNINNKFIRSGFPAALEVWAVHWILPMQMLQNSYGLFVRFPNKSFLCRNIHTFMQGRETENGFYHCSDEFYSPAEGFSLSGKIFSSLENALSVVGWRIFFVQATVQSGLKAI
ncbi:hypothetical protein [Mediterranea massiliensis]|uniref:hypothetical protein n=1 Tax=Mediterranea massiliensis TaxID=1841865 RepID=UPI0032090DAD